MTPNDIADLIVALRELHHAEFNEWCATADPEVFEQYAEMGYLLDKYYFAVRPK